MVVPISRNAALRNPGNAGCWVPSATAVALNEDASPRSTALGTPSSSVTRWDSWDNALAFAASGMQDYSTLPNGMQARRQLVAPGALDTTVGLQAEQSALSYVSSFPEADGDLASPVSCITRSPITNSRWASSETAPTAAGAETGRDAEDDEIIRWDSLKDVPGAAGATALRKFLLTGSNPDPNLEVASTASTAQSGNGHETWADGAEYNGEYRNGSRTGTGRFSWPSGSSYEGSFLKGRLEGFGRQEWPDGSRYEGQWRNDQMDGFGKFVWSDGRIYEGWYQENLKDGEGVFTWPDGRRFEGQWKDGKMHGIGKYSVANGKSRTGEWKDGERVCWFARV
mmetsp:Transcript_67148/g.119519  ORF Transcript_67148/g.119519 Transcript_67148/m.119519 type:complete len:340 (+) Transcript_67148:70-1089(+)